MSSIIADLLNSDALSKIAQSAALFSQGIAGGNVEAKYAAVNVYYGTPDKDISTAARKCECLIVEPGHFDKAPSNGIAYVPLSGLNQNNASHQVIFQKIGQLDGFLRDPSGNFIQDPQGPGTYLIDWRKPVVQNAMKEHVKDLVANKGYKGVMFDAIDSVIMQENSNAVHFGKGAGEYGITQAALKFVADAKTIVKAKSDKNQVIVNGGIAAPYQGHDTAAGFDVKKAIGESADKIMVESQFSVNGLPRNNDGDRAWLVGQLSAVASHAKGKFGFAIVDPGWEKAPSPEAAVALAGQAIAFTKGVADEVSKNVNAGRMDADKIDIAGSVVCTDHYTNPASCLGNVLLGEHMHKPAAAGKSKRR